VYEMKHIFSSSWFDGPTKVGMTFCRHDSIGAARSVACRVFVLLGTGDTVFLQHNAGEPMTGGPVPANAVTNLIPFDRIAETTGETENQVRQRLIVFVTSPEEAEGDMPVIRLKDIKAEELRMSDLEIWGLGPEHPLAQILELAMKASSRK